MECSAINRTLTPEDAERLATAALNLIPSETPGDVGRAVHIAHEMRQKQTDDAQDAALAERLGSELWTADAKFMDAARGILAQMHLSSEWEPHRNS